LKFRRSYVWIGLPIIIAAVWFFVFYIPINGKIINKRNEFNQARQQNQKVDAEIRALMETKKKEETVKVSLREYRSQIPFYDNLPDFIYRLAAKARDGGLRLDKFNGIFKSLDVQPKTILTYPVFEIGLRGRYVEIGKFLEEVGSSKAYRRILKGQISYNEKEYPLLTSRFEIEFKAWKEGANIENQ
jgi:Tfp pilus assembly protein PilO